MPVPNEAFQREAAPLRAVERSPQNPFRPYPASLVPDYSPPDYVFERNQPNEKDPLGELDWDKTNSILAHAEHVPEGWAKTPLAKMIRRRVELGIDENIHDATYWLREFDCPDSIGERITSSQNAEMTLVLAALFGEDKAKLPTSPTRIDTLFTSGTVISAYEEAISGGLVDPEELIDKIQAGELGRDNPTTHSLLVTTIAHCKSFRLTVDKEQQAETLHWLGEMSEMRQQHNRDAQSWLQNHGTTPRKKLVRAWKARNDALREGVADNPNAIITWERKAGVERAYADMERDGALPDGVSPQVLSENEAFTWELSRVYEGRMTINALANFLQSRSEAFIFPSTRMELSDGSRIEVLAKDDPRIFTVGEDTGCCMTPTGEAHECVEAAYQDPRVSILALYDAEGDIAAHSVMFTNPGEAPSTIVLDNIEINEGRDRNKIVGLYKEFFAEYLKGEELARFDTVNLGIHTLDKGYTLPFDAVAPVESPLSYSDARRQQVLLYAADPAFGPEFIPLTRSHNGVGDYLRMEKAVYGDDMEQEVPENFQIETQLREDTHSYMITLADGRPAGYVVAYETDVSTAIEEGDDNEAVIYVEDLAILPEHQQAGYGEKALRGFLKLAEKKQKPLLLHARDATSWRIIQEKEKELQEMGFAIEVVSEDPDYFSEGDGAHLVKVSKLRNHDGIR
jgi:ribosomal protein S18 acetylase RimI-like enzyme